MLAMLAEAAQRLRKTPAKSPEPPQHDECTAATAADDSTAPPVYSQPSDDGYSASWVITPFAEQLFESASPGAESPSFTNGWLGSGSGNPFDDLLPNAHEDPDQDSVAEDHPDDSTTESVDVSLDDIRTEDGTARRQPASLAHIQSMPPAPGNFAGQQILVVPNSSQLQREPEPDAAEAAEADADGSADNNGQVDREAFDEFHSLREDSAADDGDGEPWGESTGLRGTGTSRFRQSLRYLSHTAGSSRFLGLTVDVREEAPASPVVPRNSKLNRLKLLLREMPVLFKECDAGKKGFLNYAEFGLFLCKAGLLRDMSQLRYSSLCALTANLAKQLGGSMSDLSSTFWKLQEELDRSTRRPSPTRRSQSASSTFGTATKGSPTFGYTLRTPERQAARFVQFPLVEAGITMLEAVGLIMVVSDNDFSEKLLAPELHSNIIAKSLCKHGTVQQYSMPIEQLLQQLRAEWSRRTKFSRSLTFEEVYPDYTFRPRINDNSDELCSPSRQSLREAWKASGSTEHFALFCIKQNYENTQRRLEQQREWYERQFAATFQPAPTVNPESDELAKTYRSKFKELFDSPVHERLYQEFVRKTENLDRLKLTFQEQQEELDREVYTFSPKPGPVPAVASSHTQQLSLTAPTQLLLDDLPTPTGYYEEIQKIKDNYNRRVQRMLFEKSLQLREYPDEEAARKRQPDSPAKPTEVEEFHFQTAERCEQRVQRIKEELQASADNHSNSYSDVPSSPFATPAGASKALQRQRAVSGQTYQSARTTASRNDHINELHMQIKLGPRKVMTFSLREGEDIESAVERFLRKHGLPESVRDVLYKRAQMKLKCRDKKRPLGRAPQSPHVLVAEDVDFETGRRSKRREELRQRQRDREEQQVQANTEAWKQYKKRLRAQAAHVAQVATNSPVPPGYSGQEPHGALPFSPIKKQRKKPNVVPQDDDRSTLSITVNIDGNNAARLEFVDGDDAFDTARRFCIQHGVEYSLYPKLAHAILKQQRKARRGTV